MSDTVKLIIEIPTNLYEITKDKVDKNMTYAPLSISIAHGISLDDVKAEIKALPYDTDPYEYAIDDVIEILDNIGKGDKEKC